VFGYLIRGQTAAEMSVPREEETEREPGGVDLEEETERKRARGS
jgi:hypothetical protein